LAIDEKEDKWCPKLMKIQPLCRAFWWLAIVGFAVLADAEGAASAGDLAAARKFWSFQPLQNPMPPEVGPHHPIDQFIVSKLRTAGKELSPPADKRTLLRRVTYDLTGLPSSSRELEAFLSDDSPDAFAKVVDRLLDSPQYGVHWARHWFDVARYGDTRWVGAAEDKHWPFAYTYRDWVIHALNEDMPYPRFVTLQLAADQVADARPADQAALGFLTVGRWFTGQLPDVIDDQIDVVSRGFLGLSAQCARCHDHKFDPVSTEDYYSLYGLFAASRMPVDGSGFMAELTEVSARPVDADTEKELIGLRVEIDAFLDTQLTALRDEYRAPENVRTYFLKAISLMDKPDEDIRAFAKSAGLTEEILLRWVRYLKKTTLKPDPIFVPLTALAAIPEHDYAVQGGSALEEAVAGKINPQVTELLTPMPTSATELALRYVDLFLKYVGTEKRENKDEEMLRQVLRGNESPVQLRLNELWQYLSEADQVELVRLRRALLAKSATLSEHADQFLNYQHEAAPFLKEINEFLDGRRTVAATEVRSTEKIASYLLTAHKAGTASARRFRELAKSEKLSPVLLRRWVELLQTAAEANDAVFAPWRVFVATNEEAFKADAAQLTRQARESTDNAVVARAFDAPPDSLPAVAKRYAELLVRFIREEPFPDADQEVLRQLSSVANSPMHFTPKHVVDHFSRKDMDQMRDKERKLMRLYIESPGVSARAMMLRESSGGYAQRVFVRGNPELLGELAHGGFLAVLSPGESRPFTQGQGRRELAEAIVNPANPLTARVMVNRVWQWHFGTGLVRTPSDFGTRGAVPTHPDLLDWLAGQFIAEGGSLKSLHRKILLSKTWQQTSEDTVGHAVTDPENRLLGRMSRRRLTFEELRDSILAASGRLDASIGGRPADLTNPSIRRRTVFGEVDRITMPGFYRYFDFPGADAHVAERHTTIVAQQALFLMNNGFVMDQARYAAVQTAAVGHPAARVDALYRRILGRPPSEEESGLGLAFIAAQASDAPAETAPVSSPHAWRYGWGRFDEAVQRVTDFQPFPFYDGNQWKGGREENDPVLGRASLNAQGGNAGLNAERAVIRRWIAPRSGRFSLTGLLSSGAHSSKPNGDGVRGRVVSSRAGELGVWLAHGTEEPTELHGVTIESGDTVDFVIDARGREMHGRYRWAPVLTLEADGAIVNAEKVVWDAEKDFKAQTHKTKVSRFDAWGRYAQVLLQSNEFIFID
jgi:hypothetical protein